MTDDFAPELFLTRPTVGNRQTKIVQKLNMRESVQKVIEEKRSESILRGNSSSISMKRASSRVSKLSFGGDEIRTYEKVRFLSTRRSNFWSRKVFEGVQYHVLNLLRGSNFGPEFYFESVPKLSLEIEPFCL